MFKSIFLDIVRIMWSSFNICTMCRGMSRRQRSRRPSMNSSFVSLRAPPRLRIIILVMLRTVMITANKISVKIMVRKI